MGGYYNPYGGSDRISDLMLQGGQIAAQRARASGDLWANVAGNVGQIAGQAFDQYGQAQQQRQQVAQMARRDAAIVSTVESWDGQDPQALYKGLLRIGGPDVAMKYVQGAVALRDMTDKADEKNQARFKTTLQVAAGVPYPVFERFYPTLRAKAAPLAESFLGIPPDQLPEQATPEVQQQVQSIWKAINGEKPKGLTEVSPGASLYDEEKGQAVFTAPTEQKPETRGIEVQAAEALAKGDTEAYNRLIKVKREMGRADDRPERGAGSDKDHERLVRAVIANPSLWDNLTPTERGKIASDLNERGFTGFGKPMTDAAIGKIADTKSAVQSLRDLRTTLTENEQYIGPIAGLQALNPYSEANKAQAKINLVLQRVGKALEGGVLRKEDEEKYKKILSTLRDTPATAIYKVDSLISTLEKDMETFAAEQQAAGRRAPQGAPAPAPAGFGGGGTQVRDGAIVYDPQGRAHRIVNGKPVPVK